MPYRERLGMLSSILCGICLLFSSLSGDAAERYVIAPQKSQFQFKAYSVLARPVGTFHAFAGEILADAENLSASQVRFVIEATSIDTDNTKRDKHLRSADFLSVEQYPQITFISTAIARQGTAYAVEGDLQIRGVTKHLTIPVTIEQRPGELVVRGQVTLNRQDFGVTYNAMFNPVRNDVDVMFTLVGIQP
jgi:polyisoprenoid-binding protein YceI